jgi:hypothetical protein
MKALKACMLPWEIPHGQLLWEGSTKGKALDHFFLVKKLG